MKLFIQIPCLNEEETLPLVLKEIPKEIPGIDEIRVVVVDDGSTDRTSAVAKELGVDFIERNTKRLGLAFTFRRAIDICLREGADIIVNLDGDNQYKATDIPLLLAPILKEEADVVIGDRGTDSIEHFSKTKKKLQRLGTHIVNKLSNVNVSDATSGFRAFTREAALKITVLSNFTYTLETILQAQSKGLAITSVEIQVNPKTRESRLMSSIYHYLAFSAATIIRIFSMYNPLKIFIASGTIFISAGLLICMRFLYFYFLFGDSGKLQSLILASLCLLLGGFLVLVGILADLIQFNRRLQEDILLRIKRLELR